MPGADASQYIAFKKHSAAAVKPTSERNSQVVSQVTGISEGMTKFLPSLTIKNTRPRARFPVRVGVPTNKPITLLDVAVTTVAGIITYTSGVYTRGGDYTAIRQAIATQYGVSINNVVINVKPGSIIVEYQINGVPTNDPPPESIAVAIATIIENDTSDALKLTFNNNDTSCTFTLTSPRVGLPSELLTGVLSVGGPESINYSSGTVNTNGITLNYTTPGFTKVRIPTKYRAMTVILAGGGSSGTASHGSNTEDIYSTGVRGTSGGLLIFKVNTSNFAGKELSIYVGGGGIGYTYDFSEAGRVRGLRTGVQGGASIISFENKIIAFTQGGGANSVNHNVRYDSPDYTYSPAPVNSAYIPMEFISSSVASNGGGWGPGYDPDGSYIFADIYSRAQPINTPPSGSVTGYYGVDGPNNGGNGYCTLVFDDNEDLIVPELPPPDSLTPSTIEFAYLTGSSYVIPVPSYYNKMTVSISGAGGGGAYGFPNISGASGGGGDNITFTMRPILAGDLLVATIGKGGSGGANRTRAIVGGRAVYTMNPRIIAGSGGDTSLVGTDGFDITAGGGNGADCTVTYLRTGPATCPNSVGETRPNIIHATVNSIKLSSSRIKNIIIQKAQTAISATNGGNWQWGVDWGSNGSDGLCKVTFSELIPFQIDQPIKIIISGDYKSITAKYLDENNNDITSSMDPNGRLCLYSNDPDFAKVLDGVTTSDLYPASQKLVFKPGTRTITYFMYDMDQNIKSNYLDVEIPKVADFTFTDAYIQYPIFGPTFPIPLSYRYPQKLTIVHADDRSAGGRTVTRSQFKVRLIPLDIFNNKVTDLSGVGPITIRGETVIAYGVFTYNGSTQNREFIPPQDLYFQDIYPGDSTFYDRGVIRNYNLHINFNINSNNVTKTYKIIDDYTFITGGPPPPPVPVPPTDPSLGLNVTYVSELPPPRV
jgi:hypothetical protein